MHEPNFIRLSIAKCITIFVSRKIFYLHSSEQTVIAVDWEESSKVTCGVTGSYKPPPETVSMQVHKLYSTRPTDRQHKV